MAKDDSTNSGYSSSPCLAHELDDNGYVPNLQQDEVQLTPWRNTKREALITTRLALSKEQRKQIAQQVADVLDDLIDFNSKPIVSLYWPLRGELNLIAWMHAARERGATIVLPIVEAKAQPLIFREWTPDCDMQKGVWNIPIPVNTALLTPNIVISPLVGFDDKCYRLGYGGGFFDRTLAAISPRPYVIGVGYACAELPTIYPQAHDIPMDVIVTGKNDIRKRKQ